MGFVDYEVDGHVAVITINRPKALNALNEDVLKDIEAAFDAVDLSEIRAIILTGAGEKSFVAGADIAAMSVMTKEQGEHFGKFGNDIFRKIETFPVPVIAAVNGFALGGGNELANIQIVRRVLSLLGCSESLITYVTDRKGHDRRYAVDCSKIRGELGWTPQTDFDAGLEKTVRWYVKNTKWLRAVSSKNC